MLSITEENYLKSLFNLSTFNYELDGVGTNELAAILEVKPSSANDMLKKLKLKGYISYEKYGKIFLTEDGKKIAVQVVRKHRLWETFLYNKLEFNWDEVHEVAEQLEHINSEKLIQKLDAFLGFPKIDPHGDPIPDNHGKFEFLPKKRLSEVEIGEECTVLAVKDNSPEFLKLVSEIGVSVDKKIKVVSIEKFDSTYKILIDCKMNVISFKFAQNIFVKY